MMLIRPPAPIGTGAFGCGKATYEERRSSAEGKPGAEEHQG